MGFFGGSENDRSGPGGTGPVPVVSPVQEDNNYNVADCGKRVLLSHLFDFVFDHFRVQRFKHSTHMSPKSKSKR
jgi:hypothetical protein